MNIKSSVQIPYVDGQTKQWPNENGKKDKQLSTKYYVENKNSSNTNTTAGICYLTTNKNYECHMQKGYKKGAKHHSPIVHQIYNTNIHNTLTSRI